MTNGAALDAQSAPSTIDVGGDVTALRGSLLGLGCQPPSLVGNSGHECAVNPTGHSTINVRGNVTALGSAVVLLNGITIGGNVTALGGGSEIPWAIKNNTIGRNVILAGQKTDWIGVLFNHIGGNTALLAIVITDTDPGGNGALRRTEHHRTEPRLLRRDPERGGRLRARLGQRGRGPRPWPCKH